MPVIRIVLDACEWAYTSVRDTYYMITSLLPGGPFLVAICIGIVIALGLCTGWMQKLLMMTFQP